MHKQYYELEVLECAGGGIRTLEDLSHKVLSLTRLTASLPLLVFLLYVYYVPEGQLHFFALVPKRDVYLLE